MNRRRADLAAGLLVGAVVLVGLLFTWQAYARRQTISSGRDGMMGGSGMMGPMMNTGPDPLWYLLGTLVIGAALLGGYLLLRSAVDLEDLGSASAQPATEPTAAGGSGEQPADQSAPGTAPDTDSSPATTDGPDILEVLPDDERRVLEPVLDSPGLTQIALRDRADFSKSKVSQTVSELEKRGLIYREKQGRTYRVFPAEDVEES